MSDVVFEEAQAADKDAFVAITHLTFQEHGRRLPDEFPTETDGVTDQLINRYFESANIPKAGSFTRIIAVKDGDIVAGYALILFYPRKYSPDSHDLIALVYDISLLPSYRSRGIGKRLLTHCEQVMREAGATKAKADVWRDNPASTALFRSQEWGDINTTYVRRLAEPIQGDVPKITPPKRTSIWELIPFVAAFLVFGLIAYLGR